VWSYQVRIENKGDIAVQLRSRHWKITDALAASRTSRDPAGRQNADAAPWRGVRVHFRHVALHAWGSMGGVYQMVSESGENFDIEIPTFSLDTPAPSAGSIEGNDMNRMLKKGEMVSLATAPARPRARKPKPRSARCCAGRATIRP